MLLSKHRLCFSALAIVSALLLSSCETVPSVQAVQAVKAQNQITQKHIASAREHIRKSKEAQKEESDHLQAAMNDIDQLLQGGEPSPTPSLRKKKRR